ncbi:MAG: 2-oxoacid:ferredoxin oxidoreductase subunit beta [Candidatus Schekmanbacteria bacterium]|nr:2-oxoacid:ferredoxin oxidoreductase subunit beta [Candidatus Schekmanbacteria bacterium]
MSAARDPTSPAAPGANAAGLTRADYRGAPSTLCPGCGHDSITNHLQTALFEADISPLRAAKFSGIGCSSKTTNYFMNQSHGLNAVHGRMPAIATGALLANHTLLGIGISGDGDTASIGLGHFVHILRRNVKLVYIIENNGVYGLTKGQFSATADLGTLSKAGERNELPAIDCCAVSILMGCGFVARSFSGDRKQLVPLLKAAMQHRGTAVIDVISPCVTFNDHAGSTRSYDYVKAHDEPLHEVGFTPGCAAHAVADDEGESPTEVELPDGSVIALRKLEREHDPRDREAALRLLEQARQRGELVTGLIYIDPASRPFHESLRLGATPLAMLPDEKLRPSREALQAIMAELA